MHANQLSGALLAALVGASALSGCSAQGNSESDAAGAAAVRFSSVTQTDAATACHLLAPQTASELEKGSGSCGRGLTAADPPAGGALRAVEVYGLDAIVRLDGDTVFLARFEKGWRVTAAGCTPQPNGPYECDIKGG
ncbi:hypothetical protein [Humibacillus xanthopallidus]|uniref:Subtilisin inhibitor-like n=1 Tax=Humibacillus xanthopallidus TaxID=412689 RepID=A0A543HHX3_9MICO|nr:hypothetical protein [Humibacillus xanthopallidus]TQM57920.1 hypothetical protein FBY41_3261 [Humibacillus xanthopallidus]